MRPSNSDQRYRQDADVLVASTRPPLMRLQNRHASPTRSPKANASTHDGLIERLEHGRFAVRQQVDRCRFRRMATSNNSVNTVGDRVRKRPHQARTVARGRSNRLASARTAAL